MRRVGLLALIVDVVVIAAIVATLELTVGGRLFVGALGVVVCFPLAFGLVVATTNVGGSSRR